MKIYVTHSSGFDYQKELYEPIRKSKLNSEHQITLPHEKSSKPQDSLQTIKECDLVLAEVSFPSTGQGIELGWANIYKIPILCLYKSDKKPSRSLKVITDTFIKYESDVDMIQKLASFLSARM